MRVHLFAHVKMGIKMLHAALGRSTAAILARFALFISGIFLSISVAHADGTPHLRFGRSPTHNDVLVMIWTGIVESGMSEEIRTAFDANKDSIRAVELKLDSGGGSVAEGERVIAVLQMIKRTHTLYTAVAAGKECGSMCVFIYVQGQKRLAAPASLWLFHEVSVKDPQTHKITRLDRTAWDRLVDKYWVPAGVDRAWLETVKSRTFQTDYWQTGQSLLEDKANIIQKALTDEHRRVVGLSSPAGSTSTRSSR